ncbi:MAG: DUF4349 domain-containing protein [Clostridia bacterium]|nr:DUF4349 domain-containing protein [Clostridia bacterium]
MKRLLTVMLAVVLMVGCFAACAADYGAYTNDEYGGALKTGEEIAAESPSPLTVGRKIIRDARLTIETKSFDESMTALQKQIEEVGGYIESSETDGDAGTYRDAEITIRVPADKLDAFLSAAEGLGSVTYKTTAARDVTDTYVDVESRLATLTAEKEALTELLASAGSLSDILEVRNRLSQVTAELESLQARLNTMDSQIAYSTVNLTLREVELIASSEGGFWQEVGTRFVNNLARIGKGLRSFAVWFLGAIPWFLLLAVIGLGVFFIIRTSVRRKRRRRQKRQEAQQQQQQQ